MSPTAKAGRTHRSYLIEIALASALWCVNLWQIASHFHSMTFLAATTAIMIFLILPAEVARAVTALQRETA